MQALSKPFAGQKIECRSARQSQRVTISVVVRASQEEQTVVRRALLCPLLLHNLLSSMCRSMSPSCVLQARMLKTHNLKYKSVAVSGMCLLLVQARRGVLGGIIGAAALLSSPRDASAAFGDAARVSSWLEQRLCDNLCVVL